MAIPALHFGSHPSIGLSHFHWYSDGPFRGDATFASHGLHSNLWGVLLHFPHQLDSTPGDFNHGDAIRINLVGILDTTRWRTKGTPFCALHSVFVVHHSADVADCSSSLLDSCESILGSLWNSFYVFLGTSLKLDGAHCGLVPDSHPMVFELRLTTSRGYNRPLWGPPPPNFG